MQKVSITVIILFLFCAIWFCLQLPFHRFLVVVFFYSRALIPVLQQKAKKGTPQQAKHAVHCIYTIFSNRDTQFAQIFEVDIEFPNCSLFYSAYFVNDEWIF